MKITVRSLIHGAALVGAVGLGPPTLAAEAAQTPKSSPQQAQPAPIRRAAGAGPAEQPAPAGIDAKNHVQGGNVRDRAWKVDLKPLSTQKDQRR